MLKEEFDGQPVTEQNLSEWKNGGFGDWQEDQAAREWLRLWQEGVIEQSGGFEPGVASSQLSFLLVAGLARAASEGGSKHRRAP